MLESLVTDTVGGNTISNQAVQNYINFHFLSSSGFNESVFFFCLFVLFGVFFHQKLTSPKAYVCLQCVGK